MKPLQSLRFDTLNIALSYKDSFYCEWLILLLIILVTKLPHQEPTDNFANYEEDDQGEEEEPTSDIADYEEGDDGLSSEVPNYNDEEVEYIDFLS
jgi:hypothetical protein